jgi:hypothetical protein
VPQACHRFMHRSATLAPHLYFYTGTKHVGVNSLLLSSHIVLHQCYPIDEHLTYAFMDVAVTIGVASCHKHVIVSCIVPQH